MENFSDIAAGGLILFFFLRGWMKGLVKALLNIGGVIAAYLLAMIYAHPLADGPLSQFISSPLIAYPVASFGIFTGTQILSGMVSSLLASRLERKEPGRWYWLGGGAVGAATGVLYAVIVVWGLMTFKAVRQQIKKEDAPEARACVSERATKALLAAAADLILDLKGLKGDKRAEALAKAVADPARGIPEARRVIAGKAQETDAAGRGGLQELLDNPELKKMMENPEILKVLKQGADPQNEKFKELMSDPRIRKIMKNGSAEEKARALMQNPEVKKALENFR